MGLLTLLLLGSFFSALVGFFIGRSVEKSGLGFVLGLVLGPIGWIIVLLLPRNDKDRLGQSSSTIADPKNPDISFKDYKKQQKISRPGFPYSAEDQKREWSEYVNARRDEAKRKKSKNSSSSNTRRRIR